MNFYKNNLYSNLSFFGVFLIVLRSENYDGNVIYGKPIMIFRDRLYEPSGSASFLPVQRIFSKYVFARTEMDCNEMIVVVPRIRHLSI